ncbi:MAG: transposase zinc-binding domain-containing protein, partial [Candidatus Korobacteraceae bacterium]
MHWEPRYSVRKTKEKLVYHTCKSRACPSCGHRATLLWQREQWAALPDIRYAGIALTMPDVLWSIFQKNRHLLHDLPALGAAVIQQWVKVKFGASVLIMVIP